jgi:hypothetical protein
VLAKSIPPGYEIDPTALRLSNPAPATGRAGTAALAVHAEGSARAVLSDDERRSIARTVAGRSRSEAEAYLRTLPQIDGFAIEYSPGWLPHRIPSASGRVGVESR